LLFPIVSHLRLEKLSVICRIRFWVFIFWLDEFYVMRWKLRLLTTRLVPAEIHFINLHYIAAPR
jgi:hypothetical protein